MATLNTIKNWFKRGSKPTQEQFWDIWDSYWHKDADIPTSKIKNLETRLIEKADEEAFVGHIQGNDAHAELFDAEAQSRTEAVNSLQTQVTAVHNALESVSAGSITAIPSDMPVHNVNRYDIGVAGTYANHGGIVVSAADLASGSVQIRRDITGNWTKVVTPVNLAPYVPKTDIVNDLVTGGTNKALSAEQGKALNKKTESLTNIDYGDFTIQDEAGNTAFRISQTGEVEFYSASDKAQEAILPELKKSSDGIFSIRDEAGNPAFWIGQNGDVEFFGFGQNVKYLITEMIKQYSPTAPPSQGTVKNLDKLSDVNHIITYGQSLSVGQTDQVITSLNMFPNLICFDGVVRTSAYDKSLTGNVYPENRRIGFAPLKERVNDGDVPGALRETPTSGAVEMLALEINKFALTKFPDLAVKILGSAPGWGATTIAQLSKGGTHYPRLISDVQAGYDLSIIQGKQYKVLAVTWTQGESDYLSSTSTSAYKTAMIQLKTDLNADIKRITGQTDDVLIVMYQTATSNGGNKTYPNIALAQLDLALNVQGFYMATPMYQMKYNDGFHIKAESSKLLGSYYGFVINKVLCEYSNWKPMHVLSTTVQGNTIKAKFYVPKAPLKFSPANTVTLPNKGFSVMKDGIDILNSVTLGADGTSVNLICNTSPAGGLLQYGINVTLTPGGTSNSKVNMGNLHDSQGDSQTATIAGSVIPMDNWCPIFEQSL